MHLRRGNIITCPSGAGRLDRNGHMMKIRTSILHFFFWLYSVSSKISDQFFNVDMTKKLPWKHNAKALAKCT